MSTTLDEEQSHRLDRSRFSEEDLSADRKDLLLVGSRQILYETQLYPDESSLGELSDVRTLDLVLFHLMYNTHPRCGESDVDLVVSLVCSFVTCTRVVFRTVLTTLLGLMTRVHSRWFQIGSW